MLEKDDRPYIWQFATNQGMVNVIAHYELEAKIKLQKDRMLEGGGPFFFYEKPAIRGERVTWQFWEEEKIRRDEETRILKVVDLCANAREIRVVCNALGLDADKALNKYATTTRDQVKTELAR
jgi:hypothetical protein